MMKRVFCLLLGLWGCLASLHATACQGDEIVVDGESWNLLAEPIEMQDAFSSALDKFLPEERIWSTSNWDGYVGHWVIRDNRLCLEKITIQLPGADGGKDFTLVYWPETLNMGQIFAPYYEDGTIFAGWLTCELRIGKGKQLWSAHTAYERYYEDECILKLEKGVVTEVRRYHNFKREGIGMAEALEALKNHFPWLDYPELRMVKSIGMELYDFEVSPEGRLLDCKLSIGMVGYRSDYSLSWTDSPKVPWVQVFKDFFRSLHPWRILRINGHYYMYADGFAILNVKRGDGFGEGSRAFFEAY